MTVTVRKVIPVNRGREGAGAGVTEARAPATNTNQQSIWSLFVFPYLIANSQLSAIGHIIHIAWLKSEHHVREHNTYPVCDITSYP